jgi:hypothetical protein
MKIRVLDVFKQPLTVTITGLPNGVNGNVAVTGPNTNQNVTSTTTINNLTPGNYTVTGATVTNAGDSYTASPVQMVAVTAGNTANAIITYTKQVGALTVTISGLPNGVSGNVTVTGPSTNQNLTSTTTLNNLTPGNYTVAGATVTNAGDSYTASAAQMVAVTAGNTASANITYTKQVGALTVTISGATGNVTVTGPNSFSQNITTTTTLNTLTPGSYTVSAASVMSGGFTFTPNAPTQMATVTAGATAMSSVVYSASSGRLTVTITGLPNGVNGNVTVTGPNSFNQNITATTTLNNLTPGMYTVTGVNVSNGGDTYTASAAQMVAVTAGNTASASVTYTLQTLPAGTLVINTNDASFGPNQANIVVTGPNGFNQTIHTSTTFSNIPGGTYTITGNMAPASLETGGSDYVATPMSQTALINGNTVMKTVTYNRLLPNTSAPMPNPFDVTIPLSQGTVNVTILVPNAGPGSAIATPSLDSSAQVFIQVTGGVIGPAGGDVQVKLKLTCFGPGGSGFVNLFTNDSPPKMYSIQVRLFCTS